MGKNTNSGHMISYEIENFIDSKIAAFRSENTITYYRNQLYHYLAWCLDHGIQTVEEISPYNLTEYFKQLKQDHHNGGGSHAIYRAIKAFLIHWGRITRKSPNWGNPIFAIDPPSRDTNPRKGITKTELLKVLAQCDNSFYGVRDRAIISTLYDTGLRVSELCNILVKHVDLKTGIIYIPHGKGNRSRHVFMGEKCLIAIRRYLRFRGFTSPTSYLFASRTGRKLQREAVGSMLSDKNKHAGLETNPSPHDYRRAWFHETLKKVSSVTTARVGGHADTSLLPLYDYPDPEDIKLAMNGSSPLDNLK